jgi:hypothetical protein
LSVLWVKHIVDNAIVKSENIHDEPCVTSCFLDVDTNTVGDGF